MYDNQQLQEVRRRNAPPLIFNHRLLCWLPLRACLSLQVMDDWTMALIRREIRTVRCLEMRGIHKCSTTTDLPSLSHLAGVSRILDSISRPGLAVGAYDAPQTPSYQHPRRLRRLARLPRACF